MSVSFNTQIRVAIYIGYAKIGVVSILMLTVRKIRGPFSLDIWHWKHTVAKKMYFACSGRRCKVMVDFLLYLEKRRLLFRGHDIILAQIKMCSTYYETNQG